jgi:hypothetical protein
MAALLVLASTMLSPVGQLMIADKGHSDFTIVVGAKASPSEKHAARELQDFLGQMSGAKLEIRDDSGPVGKSEIILGDNRHLQALGVKIDFAKLGDEGFTIRTHRPHLMIAGGRLRGTMYGVYTFLEDHLGLRFLAADCTIIPRRETIRVDSIKDTQVPVLEYREPFYLDAFDGDWCARNKMNSNSGRLDEEHGGKIVYFGFVHTALGLLPPEKYFDRHPEYYSMINGKRIRDYNQPCWTNPDVKRLVAEEIRKQMREHPEAKVFSISQNDWGNPCQCPDCNLVVIREASQIGPILEAINYVADQVRAEFPDKIIDTLAYQYSRKPPRYIRPRPNVVVRLCSIECCFAHPLQTCGHAANAGFRQDLEGWSKACDRLWVWDYVVSFAHYLVPFPNLRSVGPNIKYLAEHNVRGIFEEGDYTTVNGEFAKLRSYLMAKFLWNPDYSYEKALGDFLEGYYGAAGIPIRQYIDLLHDKVRNDNLHAMIWEGPGAAYLTPEILARADEIFDVAERAVGADPVKLQRVQTARLPLYYVALERYQPAAARVFKLVGDVLRPDPDPKFLPTWEKVVSISKAAGLVAVSEGQSWEAYLATKAPLASGYKLEMLQAGQVGVGMVPGLGGRMLSVTYGPDKRQVLYLGGPGDSGYPATGGYGASWVSAFQGPGRTGLYGLKRNDAGDSMVLSANLSDAVGLTRTISVAAPAKITLGDVLDNRLATPQPRRYCAVLRLAGDPADSAVTVGARTVSLAGTESLPAGGVAVPADQAASGFTVYPGDVGLHITLSGDGLVGAGVSADPSRNVVTVVALLDGQMPGKGQAALKWDIDVTEGGAPPAGAPTRPPADVVVSQEDDWGLYREGDISRVDFDPTASNGFAAWMTGETYEWATQWQLKGSRFASKGQYDVYARVKVNPAPGKTTGGAFTAGVWDMQNHASLADLGVHLDQINPGEWQVWKIGRVTPADGAYLWLAPTTSVGNIQAMWTDCIWLVPAR